MALNPVALAINGGAGVSADLFRVLPYATFAGRSGVVAPGDLQVVALPTPGSSVRVNPGVGVMRNLYAPTLSQSYLGDNVTATSVSIAPTSSAGGRTSYVIMRVQDFQYEGSAPADLANGPYVFLEETTVLPTNKPYVLLAKLTIPASTATITQAMIDSGPSVREVANPMNRTLQSVWNGAARTTNPKAFELTGTTTLSYMLPTTENDLLKLEAPPWATTAVVQYTFGQLVQYGKDCSGYLTLRVVNQANNADTLDLSAIAFDTAIDAAAPTQYSRTTMVGAARFTLTPGMRGQTLEFRPVGRKAIGGAVGKFWLGSGATVSILVTFEQSAIEDVL